MDFFQEFGDLSVPPCVGCWISSTWREVRENQKPNEETTINKCSNLESNFRTRSFVKGIPPVSRRISSKAMNAFIATYIRNISSKREDL